MGNCFIFYFFVIIIVSTASIFTHIKRFFLNFDFLKKYFWLKQTVLSVFLKIVYVEIKIHS